VYYTIIIHPYFREGKMFHSTNTIRLSGVAKSLPLWAALLASGFMPAISASVMFLGTFVAVLSFGGVALELIGFATYNFGTAESREFLLLAGLAGTAATVIGWGTTMAAGAAFRKCSNLMEVHATKTESVIAIAVFFAAIFAAWLFFGEPFTEEQWQIITNAAGF
jgi:hypothetical protein